MIPATCRICHLFGIQAPRCDQFRLCVADIISVAEAATGAVAPGDDTARGGQGQAMLEATAQLDYGRHGERAKYIVREKLKEKRPSDQSVRLFLIL